MTPSRKRASAMSIIAVLALLGADIAAAQQPPPKLDTLEGVAAAFGALVRKNKPPVGKPTYPNRGGMVLPKNDVPKGSRWRPSTDTQQTSSRWQAPPMTAPIQCGPGCSQPPGASYCTCAYLNTQRRP
jgi:hypothetical protein